MGDCTEYSHVALNKSLRGKLSHLVIFLLAGRTEICQNQNFKPTSLKSSSVKQYLGYIYISKLQTLVGADLQINIICVKVPCAHYTHLGRSVVLVYQKTREDHLCSCNTYSCLVSSKRNPVQVDLHCWLGVQFYCMALWCWDSMSTSRLNRW